MKIAISSGHGKYIRGASGYIDEVDEARKVVNRVTDLLNANGVTCVKFHDDTSTSQDQNLATIVNWHNKQSRDYDVSCHFNAYSTTSKPMGTEVWYYSQADWAAKVSAGMASAGKFINRGGKKSTGLYFLSNTNKPAILLEVCFVDSSADADLYAANFEAICKSLAETIGRITIGEQPPEPGEPPEPTEPPAEETAVLTITTEKTGNMVIALNNQALVVGDDPDTPNRVIMSLSIEGGVEVFINGQKYNNAEGLPPPGSEIDEYPANQSNIIATVFQDSSTAYPPFNGISDSELSVSLPWKFAESERSELRVRVQSDETGEYADCGIRDVGPWLTDDAYWSYGLRPLAETCFLENRPLPRGPHQGTIPNGAGVDLSPAAAEAIGLSGKGKVSWTFLNAEGAPIS
jgi:N-acetylmuramoyl-L-alanine amidase